MMHRALFLDRDGVIVHEDDDPGPRVLTLIPGAARAIADARRSGYLVVVVTNQPIVARGLATEADVARTHETLRAEILAQEPTATIDAFYVCPHHPQATVAAYRLECACRKPRDGMLRAAATALGIDLSASVMIGDRVSDIAAGRRAGCRTLLVRSGAHLLPPIESPDSFADAAPDMTVDDLSTAVALVLPSSNAETWHSR